MEPVRVSRARARDVGPPTEDGHREHFRHRHGEAALIHLINHLFGLRQGDLARGFPLFGYHFLIITFYMMGRVARDAIFMAQFKPVQLPYVDIAAAVLAGAIVAVYIRAARVRSLRALQQISLLTIAVSLAIFWWGLHFEKWTWLAPALYVWVGICGALAVMQVWTLANFVWTTREAKRLFGMLGSGGIVGGIAGGFLARWTARTLGTDALLLMMAAAILPCLLLISLVWKQRPSGTPVQPDAPEAADAAGGPHGLLASARLAGNSPHLRTIAILICLAAMTTTAVSWQLKAIVKSTFETKDAMAAYLGAFTGVTGLLSLLVQLLVTTKLLRRFGVGVALLVLPVFLTVGSIAVAIWGTLWAATALKGSDAVVRYSIDSSTVQLLYLPVPGGIKLQMKSFIDTVIWKLGDGLAGFTILLFATTLGFTPRQISGVTLVLLAGWMVAAIVARRQYIATLRSNIQQIGTAADAGSVLSVDKFTTNVFAERLTSSNPEEVLGALKLFEVGQRIQTHGGIRLLLAHPSAHVRTKAISVLNAAEDTSVRDEVRALLNDEDIEVRTEALRYLTRHDRADPLAHIESLQGFGDAAIRSATIAALARPGDGQNIDAARFMLELMVGEDGESGIAARLEAAWLIGTLPDRFEDQLAILLTDSDLEVRREAIRSAGTLRKLKFAPMLINQLDHPSLGPEAAATLILFGDGVVETLRESLDSSQVPPRCRPMIPLVLMRIGSPAAAVALADSLLQTDLELRFRVISALNKLHEVRRDLTVDRPLIESSMIAELMGHYRSYQLLGALGDEAEVELKASMVAEMERIFRLVKLLFPSIDLHNAYLGVQSRDPVTHANALEFLDSTLNPKLRALLVPLVDSDVTVEERIRQADRFLGFNAAGVPIDRR